MVYGMTFKQTNEFAIRLAEKLDESPNVIKKALNEITREDVLKIAKNEIQQKE